MKNSTKIARLSLLEVAHAKPAGTPWITACAVRIWRYLWWTMLPRLCRYRAPSSETIRPNHNCTDEGRGVCSGTTGRCRFIAVIPSDGAQFPSELVSD
jgi:hypothetical protein